MPFRASPETRHHRRDGAENQSQSTAWPLYPATYREERLRACHLGRYTGVFFGPIPSPGSTKLPPPLEDLSGTQLSFDSCEGAATNLGCALSMLVRLVLEIYVDSTKSALEVIRRCRISGRPCQDPADLRVCWECPSPCLQAAVTAFDAM